MKKSNASLSKVSRPAPLYRYFLALMAAYGPQGWWPSQSALETVIGAYLTQATNWRNVERSIARLKENGAISISTLLHMDAMELRELIRPSGHIVRKAASLKLFAEWLDANHGGDLTLAAQAETQQLRHELLDLHGVGPETADVILLYALGKPVAVVDEYLRRVMLRHGLAPLRSSYAALQGPADAAFAHVPEAGRVQELNEFHALIVQVGKQHCGTVPRCEGCPLQGFLPPGGPLPAYAQAG